jgi:NodT family efflux transporter outer membrane factor (OMF) lipoprotein
MKLVNKKFFIAAVLLVGCAHEAAVRPDGLTPVSEFKFATVAGKVAGDQWWKSFQDPALDGLIERALKANPDLAVAQAHWREARAGVAAVNAQLLPRVDAQVSYQSSRTSAESGKNFPTMPRRFDTFTVGGQVNWELDLWNRNALNSQAALADAVAAGYSAENAKVSLTAEVARLWFAVQAARLDSLCLSDEFKARYREMEITEQAVKAGLLSTDPLSTAQLAAAQAKLDESNAARRLAGYEGALRALIGAPSNEKLPETNFTELKIKKARPGFGAGIPSQLLLSRPDLAAASVKLDAAMSREGSARTDFYPAVTLNGQLGWQADPASRIGRGSSGFWSLMPAVDIPIFDGDRREAQLEVARSRIDLAGAEWRKAVLNAFREVEVTLVDIKELEDEVKLAERVLEAVTQRLENAKTRFAAGVADEREVVIATRDQSLARRTHADLELELCQASVRLAAATGGGWSDSTAHP